MKKISQGRSPQQQLLSQCHDESQNALICQNARPAESALAKLCGTSSNLLAGSIVNQAISTFSRYDPEKNNASLAVAALREIAPKDSFEGMLAAQMLGTHNLAMACLGRAANGEHVDTIARNVELATKLTRTFTAQMEALNRHRGKGQQKVTVEHVTVNAGGQAIVGSVEGLAPRAVGRGASDER